MWRLIKLVLILVVLAALSFVAYAYFGPLLGADFSPPKETVTVPVELDL